MFTIPDWPAVTSFLSEEERQLLSKSLYEGAGVARMD